MVETDPVLFANGFQGGAVVIANPHVTNLIQTDCFSIEPGDDACKINRPQEYEVRIAKYNVLGGGLNPLQGCPHVPGGVIYGARRGHARDSLDDATLLQQNAVTLGKWPCVTMNDDDWLLA